MTTQSSPNWEVAKLYEAFATGQPSPLPELPIQFADFAHWQRNWLQGKVLETQLAYWRQQLGGELPVLQLPTDRPRPPVQQFHGAAQSVFLETKLSEFLETKLSDTIKAMSQQEGVTPFMFFLAVFNTLLHRYSGQDDILIGSPIANRNRAEVEELIGCFVNTLVLRTDLSGALTFLELLQRVREVALDATTHQNLPFEMLVDELQSERDLSRSPLFQVMFMMRNVPTNALSLSDLTLIPVESEAESAKFDLSFFITEEDDEFEATFEYNTDLFDDATIGRMTAHFQWLLTDIIANPMIPLSDLRVLTDDERRLLLTR